MAEYDNTNRGALFKNDRKQKDTQPDYTGNTDIEGVEYRVSAWIKKSKSGQAFMSLAYTKKEAASTGYSDVSPDDVPF